MANGRRCQFGWCPSSVLAAPAPLPPREKETGEPKLLSESRVMAPGGSPASSHLPNFCWRREEPLGVMKRQTFAVGTPVMSWRSVVSLRRATVLRLISNSSAILVGAEDQFASATA